MTTTQDLTSSLLLYSLLTYTNHLPSLIPPSNFSIFAFPFHCRSSITIGLLISLRQTCLQCNVCLASSASPHCIPLPRFTLPKLPNPLLTLLLLSPSSISQVTNLIYTYLAIGLLCFTYSTTMLYFHNSLGIGFALLAVVGKQYFTNA